MCAKEWITLAEEEKEHCDSDSPVTATLYLLSQDLLALTYILREKFAQGPENREENETWIFILMSLHKPVHFFSQSNNM